MTDTPSDVCFPVRDCANFLRNSIRNLTPLTAANALSIIDGASNISVQQLENGEDCVDLQTVLDAGLVTVLFHQPQSPERQGAFDVVLFGLQHIAELSSDDHSKEARVLKTGQDFDGAIAFLDRIRGKA